MKDVRKNSQAGFSLVELMVVVAIIGILASLAIPSVGKYMAKARQSEAKTQLSSLYTAEKAFNAEYAAYDNRFGAIGYSPEGNLRYNVGFAGGSVATVANGYTFPAAASAAIATVGYCGAAGVLANNCSTLVGSKGAAPAAINATATTTATTFIAGANAMIHAATAATEDRWTISDAKIMLNTNSGIP